MVGLNKLQNVLHEPNIVELKGWQFMHKSISLPMITHIDILTTYRTTLEVTLA
jgi:hypothetical protein